MKNYLVKGKRVSVDKQDGKREKIDVILFAKQKDELTTAETINRTVK